MTARRRTSSYLRALVAVSAALVCVALFFQPVHTWHTLTNPIQPGQLTEMPFGKRSFWLQPWRSSLVTRPATQLQHAMGINFDVDPQEAAATARLLAASGVRRARLEIPWDSMSYADTSQISDAEALTKYITAFRDNGIRPLILLNANSGDPGPSESLDLTLAAPAAEGATTVALAPASVGQVVPGLTGINASGNAAGVLITAVGGNGVATLSRPLPQALPAGPVAAATLRYQPFAPPYLADGKTPNPRFDETMSGWMSYVKTVCQFVRDVYGSDNFDVEVWNELTFGSAFLSESNYYNPVPDPGSTGSVTDAILQWTIRVLRDPANGLTGVKIGDGFGNTVPWTSGATLPLGTDAIDRHPYGASLVYPGSMMPDGGGVSAVDAQGRTAAIRAGAAGYKDIFVPRFRVLMPEYFLTGIQTETLMRDLSPIQTTIYGVPHGAGTHQPNGSPPTMWITEVNLDHEQAMKNGMPAADIPELQAKAALRYYVSYASEGVQAIDLFAAKGGACCQIIPQSFFNAVDAHPASDPEWLGGSTMRALRGLNSTLAGAQTIAHPRQLALDAISTTSDARQFTGDGAPGFPNLYNRDVLAFFPFQRSHRSFVAGVYVMTRDLTHRYTSRAARGATPYDMPPEQFRLTIGNVNDREALVSYTDPLTGDKLPATIVSRSDGRITVQLPVTDSVRMLTIDDA